MSNRCIRRRVSSPKETWGRERLAGLETKPHLAVRITSQVYGGCCSASDINL